MKINRIALALLLLLIILPQDLYAQELKPMALPMDINAINPDSTAPVIELNDESVNNKPEPVKNQITQKEAFPIPKKDINEADPTSTTLNQPLVQENKTDNVITLPLKPDKENKEIDIGSVNTDMKIQNKDDKIPEESKSNIDKDKSSDITIKKVKHDTEITMLAEVIKLEVDQNEPVALRDLRILWEAAVEKSVTIRLAIQKLSNPNESDKMNPSLMEKVLSPLANLAPIAAMTSTSAGQTAGALLGGGVLGSIANNDAKIFNKAFLHVTDYDLIMLAKEVDQLQSRLVLSYYEYKEKFEELNFSNEAAKKAYELYQKTNNSNNFAATTAADAFYREALQVQRKAKQEFLSVRANLEHITGNEAIVYIQGLKDTDLLEGKESSPKDNTKDKPTNDDKKSNVNKKS